MPTLHRTKSWSIRPLSILWLLCACVNEDALPGLAARDAREGAQQTTAPTASQSSVPSATTSGDTEVSAALTQEYFDAQSDDYNRVVTAGLGGLEAKADLNIHLSRRALALQENQRQENERKQREEAQQAREDEKAQQAFQAKAQKRLRGHYKKHFQYIAPLFGARRPIDAFYTQLAIVERSVVQAVEEAAMRKQGEQKQIEEKSQPDSKVVVTRSDQGVRQQHLEAYSQLYKIKQHIAPETLFAPREGKDGKTVLVLGAAGIGKTVFCQWLAHRWACNEEQGRAQKDQWYAGKFEAVYVLPVRNLKQDKYNDRMKLRGRPNLETAIVQECLDGKRLGDEDFEDYVRYVREQLKYRSEKVLLVLDGLDERNQVCEPIVAQAQTRGEHAYRLWLSRPYAVDRATGEQALLVENIGFNSQQIRNYVRRYYRESIPASEYKEEKHITSLSTEQKQPTSAAKELITFLKTHRDVHDLAQSPINLEIFCAMWAEQGEDSGEKLKAAFEKADSGSLISLYDVVRDKIWQRYKEKWCEEKFKKPSTELDDDEGPLFRQQWKEKKDLQEGLYAVLGDIALKGLAHGQVLIDNKTVEGVLAGNVYKENKETLRGMLGKSGFLRKTEGGDRYFPHLTLQEYFAGQELARLCRGGNFQEAARRLNKYKYPPQYRVMLRFMAGAVVQSGTGSEEGQDADRVGELLAMLNHSHPEWAGLQNLLFKLRLLNECVALGAITSEGIEIKHGLIRKYCIWAKQGIRADHNIQHTLERNISSLKHVLNQEQCKVVHNREYYSDAFYISAGVIALIISTITGFFSDENITSSIICFIGFFIIFSIKLTSLKAGTAPLSLTVTDAGATTFITTFVTVFWVMTQVFAKEYITTVAFVIALGLVVVRSFAAAMSFAIAGSFFFIEKLPLPIFFSGKLPFSIFFAFATAIATFGEFGLLRNSINEKESTMTDSTVVLQALLLQNNETAYRPFLDGFKDPNWRVRNHNIGVLGEFAATAPNPIKAVEDALFKAQEDTKPYVRRKAISMLGKLGQAAARRSEAALCQRCLQTVLNTAQQDQAPQVRCVALGELPALFAAVAQHLDSKTAEQHLDTLLGIVKQDKAASHQNHKTLVQRFRKMIIKIGKIIRRDKGVTKEEVRTAAIHALHTSLPAIVTPISSAIFEKCLETLLTVAKDKNSGVYQAAAQATAAAIQAFPQHVHTASRVEQFTGLLASEHPGERCAAVAGLLVLANVTEDIKEKAALSEQSFKALQQQITDDKDYDVRSFAIARLGELAAAVPEYKQAIGGLLLTATSDSHAQVRSAAITALGPINDAKQVGAIRTALLKATSSRDATVREAAARALGARIQAGECLDRECLQALLTLSRDWFSSTREAAMEALNGLTTKQLIEGYCGGIDHKVLVSHIRGRLCAQPLVDTPIPGSSDKCQLTLYEQVGSTITWEQAPKARVKQLKDKIQAQNPVQSWSAYLWSWVGY